MKKIWFVVVSSLLLISISVQGQERLKILSYNVLNYPNPDYNDQRADTLRKIIDHYTPDIFLIQELKSEAGLQELLDVAFNHSGEQFASAEWVSQVSNPGSTWPLQQNVIYNTEKLVLLNDYFLLTAHRDINIFRFLVKDENLTSHMDSTIFYAVSWHLKSSQGAANAQQRALMAQVLVDHFEVLDPEATVVVAGDYNIYTSNENAFSLLLNSSNAITLQDPIDAGGNWHDNAAFSYLHTQSTRTSQINGDGASGGMDDRFDLILGSENLFDPQHNMRYVDQSYEAFGNPGGNCLNQRLIDCPNNDMPANIVYALYQMSDHLPVKMEIDVTLPTSLGIKNPSELLDLMGGNLVRDKLVLQLPTDFIGRTLSYNVFDIFGHQVLDGQMSGSVLDIFTGALPAGMYILRLDAPQIASFRFVVVR